MNGLILGGGKSERMGTDKLLLTYHDVPQYEYIYNLLRPHCESIYISCQHSLYPTLNTQAIHLPDLTNNVGPAAAIEAAYNKNPGNWMIIGCDYPMINSISISELLNQFKKINSTVVYRNSINTHYEPCFGIYDESSMKEISNRIHETGFTLQSFFIEHNFTHYHLDYPEMLTSIDTIQDFNIYRNESGRKNC